MKIMMSGYSILAPTVIAAALALTAPIANAQGVEADGARDTIIGSDVQTGEVSADDDRGRILEAIGNTSETTQEVRRRFNLGDVSIVLLSDINTTDGPIAEALEANGEAIDELRIALESSAMFFHAIDSRSVLLQNVLALEFEDDDVIIFAIGGGEVR